MLKMIFAAIALFASNSSSADSDICQSLGVGGELKYVSGYIVCWSNNSITASYVDTQLQFQQLSRLNEIKTQVSGLAAELKELTSAIKILNETSKQLKEDNRAWQKNTLQSTLDAIEKTPQNILKSEVVLKAISSATADALLNDSTFISKVRGK